MQPLPVVPLPHSSKPFLGSHLTYHSSINSTSAFSQLGELVLQMSGCLPEERGQDARLGDPQAQTHEDVPTGLVQHGEYLCPLALTPGPRFPYQQSGVLSVEKDDPV